MCQLEQDAAEAFSLTTVEKQVLALLRTASQNLDAANEKANEDDGFGLTSREYCLWEVVDEQIEQLENQAVKDFNLAFGAKKATTNQES